MVDTPNTYFINYVDSPATVTYSQYGEGSVPLDPSTHGPIDITGFRKVSIRIGSTQAKSCTLHIGKISGPTLASTFAVPLDDAIHTFEVVGPQMSLWFKGAQPNSTEQVKLWVYLKS